jgi:hypothetical protein
MEKSGLALKIGENGLQNSLDSALELIRVEEGTT